MKNQILSTLGFFSLIILLSLSSCTEESEVSSIISETEIINDTIVIDGKVTLRTSLGSEELFGIYTSCIQEDGTHLNALAYANKLVIVNDEVESEGNLYVQYWVTEGPLVPGLYLTTADLVKTPNPWDFAPYTFFELRIEEVAETYLKGSLKSVNLEDEPLFDLIEGEFFTANYNCNVLEEGLEDDSYFTFGRVYLNVDETEEVFMGASSFCSDIFENQVNDVSVIIFGGSIEIDEDLDIINQNSTGLFFIFDISDKELNKKYEAVYLDDYDQFEEDIQDGITIQEAKNLGINCQILYTEINDNNVNGSIFIEEDMIGNFYTEIFICE